MVQAYSIGTSKRSTDWKNSSHYAPGPGAYNSSKSNKKQPPNWKIGTQQRDQIGGGSTPGPGAYNLKQTDGIKYTMRPKTASKDQVTLTPGSGTYDPYIYTQYKKSVSYSMGLKNSQSENKLKAPGPGTYEHDSSVVNRPTYVFGKDTNRNFYYVSKAPGPGSYKEGGRPDSQQAPKYGFGTGLRDGFQAIKNPGPGQYEAKGAMDSFYSRKSVGVTMISRRKDTAHDHLGRIPGPGTYEQQFNNKKQSPLYGIGSSQRQALSANKNPGSGSYNPNFTDRPTSSSWRIGSSVRRPLNEQTKTPGPGTYQLPQRGVEGPQLSFKGVVSQDQGFKEKTKIPGPGTYEPLVEQIKDRALSARIGSSQRGNLSISKNPGPGNYELRQNPGKPLPQWAFGTEIQRPQSSRVFVPGPGQYSLKSTFADVPKYSIPNPPSSKYL